MIFWIKNIFKQQITLTVIGLVSAVIFIWFKFLRIRLPKNLPLVLSDNSFLSLLFICLTLLFSVAYLLNSCLNFRKVENENIILITVQTYIKDSLYHLDHIIKNHLKINLGSYYAILLNYLKKHLSKSEYIFICFMFPKVLLPFILILEVFAMNHIYYFYKAILLMIIPLIYKYIYYCLHWFYIEQLESLERVLILHEITENDDQVIVEKFPSNGFHYYIQEHTMNRLKIRPNDHQFNVELNPNFISTTLRNFSEAERDIFYENYCMKALPFCSKLYEVLYYYTIYEKKFKFYLNLYMLLSYLICWTYVLYTANFTFVSLEYLTLLDIFKDNEEPFSQTAIS